MSEDILPVVLTSDTVVSNTICCYSLVRIRTTVKGSILSSHNSINPEPGAPMSLKVKGVNKLMLSAIIQLLKR